MVKSNFDVNWAEQYDIYETKFRDMYKTNAKQQNDSHWEMLTSYLKKNIRYPKKLVFAEIGFGAGLTLRKAAKLFYKVYGLDISKENVRITYKELKNEGYKNIFLEQSNIMIKEDIYKKKFDVISFIHGLEHFSQEDYKILFENIKYYLKPGGIFTGALPNNLQFNYRRCPKCGEVFEIDGHLSIHTKESLRKLFYEYSFEIIKLSDFNIQYYLKYKGVFKTIYRFILHKILRNPSTMQLEFIVKPIQFKKI